MAVMLAMGIGRIHPDEGIKPMLGYVLALLIGPIVIAAVPWFSIGLIRQQKTLFLNSRIGP